MVFFKILPFVLSAIIAIGGLCLSEPSKPKLVFILSSLITVLMLIGIVLEIIDAKSKKQKQAKVVAQNTKLSGKIKQLDEQNKELINGKNELIAGKDELLAQNKTLRKELAQIAQKDIYKPLSPILRQQLIDSLRQIKKPKEIIISDMNTNYEGKKVVFDLIDIFKEAGINTRRGSTGIAFGTSVISPQIKMNENLRLMAERLHKILSLYVKTGFTDKFDDSLDEGVINIIICGVPLFYQDGTIKFH